MQLTKLANQPEIDQFRSTYEKLSDLTTDHEYLSNNTVYTWYLRGEMIGGFVLGKGPRLRTIKTFVSPHRLEGLIQSLSTGDYCEVCCLWVKRIHRKRTLTMLRVWLQMAYIVSKQPQRMVMYGTNYQGLAEMYGMPRKSYLLHQDQIDGQISTVYHARVNDFFWGVAEICWCKLAKSIGLSRRKRFVNTKVSPKTVVAL